MDFLDSLDVHTPDKKSNRVRSWYLYEQYKSLEKNQLDAAKKLKNRSCQDRILHRELNERRARRRFSDNHGLSQSSSRIERSIKRDTTRTPFSESSDSFFESVSEQEDVVSGNGPKDTLSEHSTNKFCDDFKSLNEKKDANSRSESITSVVERPDLNENIADDIKLELEFVKKNIAEIINLQLETEKECLETCTELCNNDTFSDSESLNSLENLETKSVKTVDKYYPKYDNGVFAIWSKLVTFSYNLMQMNRGNCYYDFSSQFLTAVLAFDVLRRGINRMCHILQPFVSPIKFTNDESDASSDDANENLRQNRSHLKIRKSNKNVHQKCRVLKFDDKPHFCQRKYSSENRWQSCCKYSVQNRLNKMRSRGASEPWRSVAKFSGGRNSFKENFPRNKFLESYKKDNCSSNCKCQELKKAINPILKLSRYMDMILQEIDD